MLRREAIQAGFLGGGDHPGPENLWLSLHLQIDNYMKRLIGILFLLAGLASTASAQSSDLGTWWIYFGNLKIGERFDWHHEIQYRNYNVAGDLEQLLIRTGIGYNLSENNNNLLLGYGYILSQNYLDSENKDNVNEHRIFQQYITRQSFGRVKLLHRYRFEQRWIEGDFRMRARYFLLFNIALSKPDMLDNTLYLSAYNEIFLNLSESVFDRNRIYGGLGYKFNDHVRVELSYMTQVLETSSRDQINVVVFGNF
jgi:hypothetical protein